jgi:hypothetical protein
VEARLAAAFARTGFIHAASVFTIAAAIAGLALIDVATAGAVAVHIFIATWASAALSVTAHRVAGDQHVTATVLALTRVWRCRNAASVTLVRIIAIIIAHASIGV